MVTRRRVLELSSVRPAIQRCSPAAAPPRCAWLRRRWVGRARSEDDLVVLHPLVRRFRGIGLGLAELPRLRRVSEGGQARCHWLHASSSAVICSCACRCSSPNAVRKGPGTTVRWPARSRSEGAYPPTAPRQESPTTRSPQVRPADQRPVLKGRRRRDCAPDCASASR